MDILISSFWQGLGFGLTVFGSLKIMGIGIKYIKSLMNL